MIVEWFWPALLSGTPLVALGWIRWRASKALAGYAQQDPDRAQQDPDRPLNRARRPSSDSTLLQRLGELHLSDGDARNSAFHSLGSPARALLARIQLCEAAASSLDLMYYTLHDDTAGGALLSALREAALRGVRVRLLLDDLDALKRDHFLSAMAREVPDLEIRMFNPLWWRRPFWIDLIARFPRSTRRMHNKCFIADAQVAIVGGRNIGDEYFDLGDDTPMLDFDLVTLGPVVKELLGRFNDYWSSGIAIPVCSLSNPATEERYRPWLEQLSRHRKSLIDTHELTTSALNDLLSREMPLHHGEARVLGDPPEKVVRSFADSSGWMVKEIYDVMELATHEILLVSPYLVPGNRAVKALSRLVERGVRVRVLTNSHASNDVLAVHSGYMGFRKSMLLAGVELYELRPDAKVEHNADIAGRTNRQHSRVLRERMQSVRELWKSKRRKLELGKSRICLHAKTFVIDRRYLFVGSFNLDPRSAVHNTEMGVVFDNRAEAEAVVHSIEDWLERNCYQLALDDSDQMFWLEQRDISPDHVEPSTITDHIDVEPEHTAIRRPLTVDQAMVDPRYRVYPGEPGMTPPRKILLDVMRVLPVQWLL